MLAVITPSHSTSFRTGASALASAGGQLIAVVGRMSAEDASELAASRRGNAPAMALVLAVSAWASDGISEDTARTAQIVGRGLAGPGGQGQHPARGSLAAAAPARGPDLSVGGFGALRARWVRGDRG